MSNKVALICGLDVRVSSTDLQKLGFISSQLGYGSNKSKAVRHMIDFFAEYLASEQQSEAQRCI